MLTKSLLRTKDSYSTLLAAIKKEIESSRRAIEQQKTLTYWKVGELISKHILENKDRAKYGRQLFKRLSSNLEIGERVLYQAIRFYEAYPILHTCAKLGWSHYRTLLAVKDESQRQRLEKRIIREGLTSRELEAEIKRQKPKAQSPKPQTLSPLPVIRG